MVGRIAGVSPEETRTRLLHAAARVFAKQGYEGSRVGDIAREAGLSSGAIYAHYDSKADLLVDAIRAHGPNELGRLIDAGDVRVPLPELLVRLGASLEHRDETQGSLLLEAMAASRRDPELAAVLTASLAGRESLVSSLARHGQHVGDIDPGVSADALARFSMLVVLGAMVARVLDLPPTDPSEWTELITRLVDGVRTEENP